MKYILFSIALLAALNAYSNECKPRYYGDKVECVRVEKVLDASTENVRSVGNITSPPSCRIQILRNFNDPDSVNQVRKFWSEIGFGDPIFKDLNEEVIITFSEGLSETTQGDTFRWYGSKSVSLVNTSARLRGRSFFSGHHHLYDPIIVDSNSLLPLMSNLSVSGEGSPEFFDYGADRVEDVLSYSNGILTIKSTTTHWEMKSEYRDKMAHPRDFGLYDEELEPHPLKRVTKLEVVTDSHLKKITSATVFLGLLDPNKGEIYDSSFQCVFE